MKLLRFAPALVLLTLCVAARADDDDKQAQPPEEIPDFSNLDEYIYVPKTTVNLGTRFLSGPKTSFHGQGLIPSPEDPGSDPTIAGIDRTYHDGRVDPDSRTVTVDNGNGTSTTVPVASDGKTDTWSYDSASQVTADGYIQFHTYSGTVTDTGTFNKTGDSNMGIELVANHEMGSLGRSKKITWSIVGGMSINDLRANMIHGVQAAVTTTTDTYDLFGQVAPTAPYSGPGGGVTTQNVLDSSGNAVNDQGGTAETQTVDNPTLLGNVPLARQTSTTTDSTTVQNSFKIEGAYYTFRVGPSVSIPLGKHWKLIGSVGAALVYAGDEFTAEEELTPVYSDGTQGTPIDTLYDKSNTRLLPGYYADLTVQYNLTDTAGFYAGGVFQSAGSYTQTVASGGTDQYTTKIDLSNQNGIRAGMSVKF